MHYTQGKLRLHRSVHGRIFEGSQSQVFKTLKDKHVDNHVTEHAVTEHKYNTIQYYNMVL